jgi:hypothetical protein
MGNFSSEEKNDGPNTACLFLLYNKTTGVALELHIMSDEYPTLPLTKKYGDSELEWILVLKAKGHTFANAEIHLMDKLNTIPVGGCMCEEEGD